jgi:type I restriction enzyme S subunit
MREMKDSGVEWLGKIPNHWMIRRIKNLFELRNEKNYEAFEDVNLISLYTDKGVVQHSDLTETTGNKAVTAEGYKIVKEDDIVVNIILCWMGAVGRSAYNGVTSPAYDVYKPLHDTNSKYYHYLFRTSQFNGECYRYGRGIMLMRWRTYSTEFRAISVPLPPEDEQERIVEFLDKKLDDVDRLIGNVQTQIEKLKAYKQSLITEVVTKGLDSTVPMKNSGVEWIGEIPEKWSVVPLKSKFSFGKGLPITKDDLVEEGIPVISYGQIHAKWNTGVTTHENLLRYVNESYLESNSSALVKKGDLIMADTSEDRDGCGNCAYIDIDETVFAGYHTIILNALNSENNKYFAYLFLTDNWRSQIRKAVSGVKLFSISRRILGCVSVLVPNNAEDIVNYLDAKCAYIDRLIAIKQAKIEKLEQYKRSLIYEYVTGKKEVS